MIFTDDNSINNTDWVNVIRILKYKEHIGLITKIKPINNKNTPDLVCYSTSINNDIL
jgi:hypothetical protein